MFVEFTQDKIDLIAKIIKSNQKFTNNEDLYDDFFNEACRRSVSVINAIENDSTLEAYLRKVVSTSIINVLKDSGRLRRSRSGYMTTREVPLDTVAPFEPVSVSPAPSMNTVSLEDLVDYSSYSVNYDNVSIPYTPEENALHNEVVNFIADTLEQINEEAPEEHYMDIFIMRYDKCMTQKQMAQELGISQSEVSKRIYGLLEKIKDILDEQ